MICLGHFFSGADILTALKGGAFCVRNGKSFLFFGDNVLLGMKIKLHGFRILEALLNERSVASTASRGSYYGSVSVEKLFEVEARGREIATELRDQPAWHEVREWIHDLESLAVDVASIAKDRGDEDIYKMAKALVMSIGPLLTKIRLCEGLHVGSLSNCEIGYDKSGWRLQQYMHKLNETCKEVLGEPCCYFGAGKYTLTLVVNDMASCFHRLAEMVEKVSSTGLTEYGKCVFYPDADPNLVGACKVWDRLTKTFNELELYEADDYEELKAVVRGREAELRVGSTPGHRTHINLDTGTLRYYDDDQKVNQIFNRLLGEIKRGPKCQVVEDEVKGVFFSHVTEDNIIDIMRCLATVTSMDIREPATNLWWLEAIERIPGLKTACPGMDEYCLLKNTLEYFKTHEKIEG